MANKQQQGGSFVIDKNGKQERKAFTNERVIDKQLEQMNAPDKPAAIKKDK